MSFETHIHIYVHIHVYIYLSIYLSIYLPIYRLSFIWFYISGEPGVWWDKEYKILIHSANVSCMARLVCKALLLLSPLSLALFSRYLHHTFTSFRSLFKCHLLSETFPKQPIYCCDRSTALPILLPFFVFIYYTYHSLTSISLTTFLDMSCPTRREAPRIISLSKWVSVIRLTLWIHPLCWQWEPKNNWFHYKKHLTGMMEMFCHLSTTTPNFTCLRRCE
jgi:hypothetical protein